MVQAERHPMCKASTCTEFNISSTQMEIIMGKLVLAQNSPPQGQLEGLIEP